MLEFLISSLMIGFIAGYFGQRSGFCTMAGIRNLIMFKNKDFFMGILGVLVGGFLGFLTFSLITPQPFQTYPEFAKIGLPILPIIALMIIGWLGVGFFSTYSNGCPFRMHVRSGTGDLEAIAYFAGFSIGILYYLMFVEELIDLILAIWL